jgi:putative colanic acid biosynthesis UDP-glucose lipid carrier transferase
MLKDTEEFSGKVRHYMVRHFVKPGITGWAQIKSYRGETTEVKQVYDRLKHDIWYLENWSFWLDIRIMASTILQIFGVEKSAPEGAKIK